MINKLLVACVALMLSASAYAGFESRMVPLLIDGEQVRLAFRIHKPDGEGPFPTLIFHHGSTGWGTDPALFKKIWEPEAVADYFTRRGWLVVLPYRRGRGESEGFYDEGFNVNRKKGYTCNTKRSLAGADRALADIDAITNAVVAMPSVDASRLLIGGISRGGILSIAHAGRQPERYRGVINFVGGWLGEGCPTARKINRTLFKHGVNFKHETLWLYAYKDPYYSMRHSKGNFKAFRKAGGVGTFIEISPKVGHDLPYYPEHWDKSVEAYLERIQLATQTTFSGELLVETVSCNLPDDFAIQSADGLPKNIATFLGVFSGKWKNELQSTLIVESVDEDGEMEGYYSWGAYEPWGIKEPGCIAVEGEVKKNKLSFEMDGGQIQVSYKIKKGYLFGRFKPRETPPSTGKFHRQE